MNENKTEGAAKVVLGKFESAAGQAVGDASLRARGGARQVEGRVQETAGSVQETLEQVAGQAKAALSTASDAYAAVSGATRGIARTIEDEPYMAVGVATAVGLLIGLLIAGRGPKIIYVKPRV